MKKTENLNLIIKKLGLSKHVEGGYFRETYRSNLPIITRQGQIKKQRSAATAIYFLLTTNNFSAFHRLKCDEIWNYHLGSPVLLYTINDMGKLITYKLGPSIAFSQQPQLLIEAGLWFAAIPQNRRYYSLVSCLAIPGFDYEDFEMAKRDDLLKQFPQHRNIILKLTRD